MAYKKDLRGGNLSLTLPLPSQVTWKFFFQINLLLLTFLNSKNSRYPDAVSELFYLKIRYLPGSGFVAKTGSIPIIENEIYKNGYWS